MHQVQHILDAALFAAGMTLLDTTDSVLMVGAYGWAFVEPLRVERFGHDVAALVVEMTDDKSLPKAERKRLQIEHAPKISERAQIVKLADKISNLRSILSSPPADWDYERKRQYFAWGKRVVDALSAPNPTLKAEFERTYNRFEEVQP